MQAVRLLGANQHLRRAIIDENHVCPGVGGMRGMHKAAAGHSIFMAEGYWRRKWPPPQRPFRELLVGAYDRSPSPPSMSMHAIRPEGRAVRMLIVPLILSTAVCPLSLRQESGGGLALAAALLGKARPLWEERG